MSIVDRMKFFSYRCKRIGIRKNNRLNKNKNLQITNPQPTLVKCSMSVEKAQMSKVVRLRGFLSIHEISVILEIVKRSGLPCYTSNQYEDVSELGAPLHTTMYLQTDNFFQNKLYWLQKKIIKIVKKVNKISDWGFHIDDNKSFNIRVAEYHEMFKGGSLRDSQHYDIGSLITVDIMLQEATDGGFFSTLERSVDADCNISFDERPNGEEYLRLQKFKLGDALVFVSHKYHCVSPVIAGYRKVLVIELWNGPRPTCGHRCDDSTGNCHYAPEG